MRNAVVEQAIKRHGNSSRLAADLGTSRQRVEYWRKSQAGVPAEMVLKFEEVTGIPRHKIRPDLYTQVRA